MQQPLWLDHAWRLLGERERAGSLDNPLILDLYRDAGALDIRHDETAWCAAFVGACLERAGVSGTRSLMARSYLSWGEAIEEGRLGAVAVFSRGSNSALGHVGFLVGEAGASLIVIGGNQGDAVTVAAIPRARLLGLRWAQTTSSPAVMADQAPRAAAASGSASFEAALAHVLEMEGGWTDDPYDPGGPTNQGITLRVYAAWKGVTPDATSLPRLKAELQHIPSETVHAIYLNRYWQPSGCAELPPSIAFMQFDAAVNHGTGTAVRMLQEAAGAEVDGEVGPVTRRSVAEAEPDRLLARYAEIRRQRYRSLSHFWRFGRGWLRRVDRTLDRAKALVAPRAAPTSTSTNEGQNAVTTTSSTSQAAQVTAQSSAKWWGQSMTIWGALITTIATVLPAVGPLIGVDITPELVKLAGDQMLAVVQAVAGLTGTIMTIYGRSRAAAPLERRFVSLKI